MEKLSAIGGVWDYIEREKRFFSNIFRNIQELTDSMSILNDEEFDDLLDFLIKFLYDYESGAKSLFQTMDIEFFIKKLYYFHE